MKVIGTLLIILHCLNHVFARGIPETSRVFRNWPYIPIPASDEVRRPPFGRSSFFDEFGIVDDSSGSDEPDTGRNFGESAVANTNIDSEEELDVNTKQNGSDDADSDLNKESDEEGESKQIDDDQEDEEDQNRDGDANVNEEEEEKYQDEEDDMQNEGKKEHEPSFSDTGLFLNRPFFNLEQMTNYIKELERAFEQVFRQTMQEAALLNGTFANTTEEKVDVNGQTFLVQKSVIKTGDNNSSIFIEAVDVLPEPETNRTKRSNWYAEKAQKAKESDP